MVLCHAHCSVVYLVMGSSFPHIPSGGAPTATDHILGCTGPTARVCGKDSGTATSEKPSYRTTAMSSRRIPARLY